MFDIITKTWNPVKGCHHGCKYCWAHGLAEGKLAKTERYADGMTPKLIEKELNRRWNQGCIFVSDMGDLFGSWVPDEWIEKILDAISKSPKAEFLLLTKNPAKYFDFISSMPKNVILGATIETNKYYKGISDECCPHPLERIGAMIRLPWPRKLVSVEPVMGFDVIFIDYLKQISPQYLYFGYDNYKSDLPEPPMSKSLHLLEVMQYMTRVKIKSFPKEGRELEPVKLLMQK